MVAAIMLSGCASIQQNSPLPQEGAPLRAEMQIDHALPAIAADPSDNAEEILTGSVRLGTPTGLIDYGASYHVRRGKFFEAIRDGKDDFDQAQNEVALQTMEQTLGSTLDLPAAAPVKLKLTRREQTRLGFDAGNVDRSTRADMRWSPGPVDLHVEWTQPDAVAAGGVNCNLRAGLRLPAGFLPAPAGSVLELSGQRCQGSAPTHGINALAMARWGAAWHWGAEHNSVLQLMRTEATMPSGSAAPLMPDYELGLSHRHLLPGGWQARADVSVLRTERIAYAFNASPETDATDWTAQVALKRELKLMAVTARWAHAAERVWFATATKQLAGDRFSLALDFGAWLNRLWPRVESAMDVSWNWRESREGESDNKLSWNVLIGW